jgi:hypothetical protein
MTALLLALAVQTLPVVEVTPPYFGEAKEPQIAIDADHTVYCAFGKGDAIYVCKSTDQGKTYGTPILVSDKGRLSLGMRRGPRVAALRGNITVTAVVGDQGRGRDGDLMAWRSADKGRSWTGPSRVNDVAGSAREGLHAMAIAPGGTLACIWLDLRGRGTKLYLSSSKDRGASWSSNRLAYESPSGTICQCCHPSLSFNDEGILWIMFRNVLGQNRDMYDLSTSDLGKTFSPAKKLGAGSWEIDRCPMDGGMISAASNPPATIWRRNGGVFTGFDNGAEKEEAPGSQPWLASGLSRIHYVWLRGNEIVSSSNADGPAILSEKGDDPVVSSSPDHRLVIAAWTEKGIKSVVLQTP